MAISTTVKSIQDIMRKDVGVDGDAQRIGQLVWMLFLKIYDDRETEWETFDDNYRSPLPEHALVVHVLASYEEIEAHLELLHKDEEALKAFVKTSVMRND